MPNWSTLLNEFKENKSGPAKSSWLNTRLNAELRKIASRRNTNVIVYASAFLQKPRASIFSTSINREDINGFMATVSGLDFSKGLTLVLHTPGGDMPSTETIVDYLRSKFDYMETIVPAYAMSGGTMIALNSEKIIMGRQSQLGPIDAQLMLASGYVPASSVLRQFAQAKQEIDDDRIAAIPWSPILQTMGPALLQRAQDALELGEQIARNGLKRYMFKGRDRDDAVHKAQRVAQYFNSTPVHLDHGRRIGIDECIATGLNVELLENNQDFQDEVLTTYHLLTILFEQSSTLKDMRNHNGLAWNKSSVDAREAKKT